VAVAEVGVNSGGLRSIALLKKELAQLRRYEKAIAKVQDKTASLKAKFCRQFNRTAL